MSIINEDWQWSQIIFISQSFIVDFHETDSQLICFIVDVFQFLQGLCAFFAFRFVCKSEIVIKMALYR